MITSTETIPKAHHVWLTEDMLYVRLEDGREIGVPLEWFPKLVKATPEERNNWRLIGKGIGIHWADIDEDISVKKLFQ
jgi:hypothetical protein